MIFIIYTKNSCSFCNKAKDLLEARNLEYIEKDVRYEDTKQELLKKFPEAKTVPQIFLNNTHIGGYTDLETYLENIT